MTRCRNWRVRGSRGFEKSSVGRPLLDDAPAIEEEDPVGDVSGEAHLVGRNEHRHPAPGELSDDVEHLGDELWVECARDLVKEEQVRLHRERPHDRDPLLLATRQPIRVFGSLVVESEAAEKLDRRAVSASSRHLPRTRRGARVTLSRTRRCGKRLNAWKTMPTDGARCRRRAPGAVMSSPATQTRPASMGSRRLMHRRRVDLPDPDAPGKTTSCSRPLCRSLEDHSRPNDFRRPSIRSWAIRSRVPPMHVVVAPTSQSTRRATAMQDKEDHRGNDVGRDEGRRLADLGRPEDLDDAQHAHERQSFGGR